MVLRRRQFQIRQRRRGKRKAEDVRKAVSIPVGKRGIGHSIAGCEKRGRWLMEIHYGADTRV